MERLVHTSRHRGSTGAYTLCLYSALSAQPLRPQAFFFFVFVFIIAAIREISALLLNPFGTDAGADFQVRATILFPYLVQRAQLLPPKS